MKTKASGHCGPCREGATIPTAATSSGPACGSRLAQKVPDVGGKGQCRRLLVRRFASITKATNSYGHGPGSEMAPLSSFYNGMADLSESGTPEKKVL